MSTLKEIFDWSEVWAPLIPLIIYFLKRPTAKWTKPVVIYLFIAFFLSLIIDVIWKMDKLGISEWMFSTFNRFYDSSGYLDNTLFYNLLSIARLLLFCWFFGFLALSFRKLNKFVPVAFVVFSVLNFIFWEDITAFSSRILAAEAGILLVYCIIYFFTIIRGERITASTNGSTFMIVIGLSIYVAINFFIFLFFKQLTESFDELAMTLWNYHNAANIVFCLCIAFGFYKNERPR